MEYQNVAVSPPGVESEITRKKRVVLVTVAEAAVVPVLVVTQDVFIVIPFTILIV